jgi:plastocyanin domain-containing protein
MSEQDYQGEERRHTPTGRRRKDFQRGEQFIVIKSWQTLVVLLTLIATLVLSYGTLQERESQDRLDIRELKEHSISRDQFESLDKRLARIEDKLDKR